MLRVDTLTPVCQPVADWACSVMSDSLGPFGLKPARLLCPGDSFQARILEWAAVSSSRGILESYHSTYILGHRNLLLPNSTSI